MASYALELFQLENGCFEFMDNGGRSILKSRHTTPIEPTLVVSTRVEPGPDVRAVRPVVSHDGAHVIEFVSGSHELHGGRCRSQVSEIALFTGLPRWLGINIGVRTAIDNGGDSLPELRPNQFPRRRPPLIFHRVMEQRCNRLIFVAAVGDDEARNRHQVRDVRDCGAFAVLSRMEPSGEC